MKKVYSSLVRLYVALFCSLFAFDRANAGGASAVAYEPVAHGVTNILPAASTYVLSVTSPSTLTAPATVTLTLSARQYPVGDAATALKYVRFSTPTLTFERGGQTLPVTVTIDFPITALSKEVTAGAYMYEIRTEGWPKGVTDSGSSINASVSAPLPAQSTPPVVTIPEPIDGSTTSIPAGQTGVKVPFNFTAVSQGGASGPITSVDADVNGEPVQLTTSPLSTSVSASAQLYVTSPGTYTVTARANNAAGKGSDVSTFTVDIPTGKPTVAIATPSPAQVFELRTGNQAVTVPFTFSATSNSAIRTLTAKLDGAAVTFSPAGIGSSAAFGSFELPYFSAGTHTLSVTATDGFGSATATSSFSIVVVEPEPAVSISAPSNGQVLTLPAGSATMDVSYVFKTTVKNGFIVDSISASLGSTALTPTTDGLYSAAATSTGTLNLGAGTYSLTATGGSMGKTATSTVSFTIVGSTALPTVSIDTPAEGYTLELAPGSTGTVPLTFTARSQTAGAVITTLRATLNGNELQVSTDTLGHPIATGAATLSVGTAGTHHIVVTAMDSVGSATASRSFDVTIATPRTIRGGVFFDLNGNGDRDAEDFGLGRVKISLANAQRELDSTYTAPDGSYSFSGMTGGRYFVSAKAHGFSATTPAVRVVTVGAESVTVPDFGFKLNLLVFSGMKADGRTIGFWKNNIDKALAGKTKGTQVSAAVLAQYTTSIGDFASTPFDRLTMKQAFATMSSNSSKPADLLAKQLLAAEYNYQNGAYLDGNATLTYAFLAWGEHVLSNARDYSSQEIISAKDWFDAYNNSHGGCVGSP